MTGEGSDENLGAEFWIAKSEWRIGMVELASLWPFERRARYLLNPRVGVPLSSDRRAWPAAPMGRGFEVAITVIGEQQMELQRWLGEADLQPAFPDTTWCALGYDVCDATLISALSNCGYFEPTQKQAFDAWVPMLNAWHLFDSRAAAQPFASASDSRVAEHRPFGVFRLYGRAGRLPRAAAP